MRSILIDDVIHVCANVNVISYVWQVKYNELKISKSLVAKYIQIINITAGDIFLTQTKLSAWIWRVDLYWIVIIPTAGRWFLCSRLWPIAVSHYSRQRICLGKGAWTLSKPPLKLVTLITLALVFKHLLGPVPELLSTFRTAVLNHAHPAMFYPNLRRDIRDQIVNLT
jgi:hypothetical protein